MGWDLLGDLGRAANTVGTTAIAVADEAQKSIALQAVGAVATGGLSLVAQGVVAGATGQANPFTSAVAGAVADPLKAVGAIPGVVLGELGLPGIVATGAKIGAAAVGGLTGSQEIKDIGRGVGAGQKVLRDRPDISGAIIVGAAGAALGGTGLAGLGKGLGQFANAAAAELGPATTSTTPAQLSGADRLAMLLAGDGSKTAVAPSVNTRTHIMSTEEAVRADALRTRVPFKGDFWQYFGRRQ